MRITALLLIASCIYACKEEAYENEAEFKLNKFEAGSLDSGFYLGGGLCVYKHLNRYDNTTQDPIWEIRIVDCYNFLIDTVVPTKNVKKYRQGGLCFSNDCSIKPEKSFTMFMRMPESFMYIYNYRDINIFASKYNNSTMLYNYAKAYHPYESDQDTITFFKKYDKSWEELFSMAKLLEIKDEHFSDKCNSKFCSTKDFLNPLYQINCRYGVEPKNVWCYSRRPRLEPCDDNGKHIPKCLSTLEKLSEKYGIVLMHSGAFPAGDCDLGNWRYLKIDSLSKEHYEKLKDLVKHPDSAISSGL